MTGGSNWISVGELGDAFAREPNLLPGSAGLVGRTCSLYFENGWIVDLRFAERLLSRSPRQGDSTKCPFDGAVEYSAVAYGPQGVRVNAVCPGWVRTPMADEEMQPLMRDRNSSLDEAYAFVTKDVPLRRAAQPAEIASICYFLASSEASIVTGALIVADGGSTIVAVPTLAFS